MDELSGQSQNRGGNAPKKPKKPQEEDTDDHTPPLVALSAASADGLARSPGPARRARFAQAWPTRLVKLVVPFTPGGGIDASRASSARGCPRSGASRSWSRTSRAPAAISPPTCVARSAPDGYTMYITAAGLALNRFLFQSITYDPVADFAPVTLICLFPNLLVVPNSSPIRSVADLLAEAKKNPGKITFASPGHGSSPHMSGELFKHLAKVDLTHVPYRGASPRYTDVIAGRVDFNFAVMASGLPLVRSGQAARARRHHRRAGAVGARRATIAEAGVPGYDTSSWFAFFVPAKTPPDIIRKMHADTVAVLAEPPIKAKLEQLGLITVGSTPEAARGASQVRDGEVGARDQGRQHQGQRYMITRRPPALAESGARGALPAPPFVGRAFAQIRSRPGRTASSGWSCRFRRAAAPTPSPAWSPASSRRCGASRWWSRTRAVAPPISAPKWSRAPIPTATPCCCSRCRSRSTGSCSRRCPTIRSPISRR